MSNPITSLQEFLPIALAFFDSNTPKEQKNEFNQHLQELYKSEAAWKICKDILSNVDQYTAEVKFLAAKILRIKLYYYMIEVPASEHEPMLMYIVSKFR
jgi:hypothetical protein